MTRQVTYCTEKPLPSNSVDNLSRQMSISVHMWDRGYNVAVMRYDSGTCIDYSLEAPETLPAGGCEQFEVDCGEDEDRQIQRYVISASQLTVQREPK